MIFNDSFRHQGLRKKLIEEIRNKGIIDENVLNAMMRLPRHYFFENAFLEFAYADKAFPIAAGQTISQPYTVAYQTHLLDVQKGEKVLEIGTGSGYQTGILCELGAKVFSIERQKELYDKTKIILEKLNYKPKLFYGDWFKGLPAFAPFDKILITCGAPEIPPELLKQLKTGGLLVVPLGKDVQTMTTVMKLAENKFETHELDKFRFVPMLKDKAP